MIKVGLTGGIGSGKSTVAAVFEKLGIPVFYADAEAKWLLDNDAQIKATLVNLFGNNLYQDNKLNRAQLAQIIFTNSSAIKHVNSIMHPAVAERFNHWVLVQNAPYVLQEAAILFETGGYKRMDKNILVSAPKTLRITRIKNRDGATTTEVENRMANQWDDEQKAPLADFIIVNDESTMLLPQIKRIHEDILRFANKSR